MQHCVTAIKSTVWKIISERLSTSTVCVFVCVCVCVCACVRACLVRVCVLSDFRHFFNSEILKFRLQSFAKKF